MSHQELKTLPQIRELFNRSGPGLHANSYNSTLQVLRNSLCFTEKHYQDGTFAKLLIDFFRGQKVSVPGHLDKKYNTNLTYSYDVASFISFICKTMEEESPQILANIKSEICCATNDPYGANSKASPYYLMIKPSSTLQDSVDNALKYYPNATTSHHLVLVSNPATPSHDDLIVCGGKSYRAIGMVIGKAFHDCSAENNYVVKNENEWHIWKESSRTLQPVSTLPFKHNSVLVFRVVND